MAPEPKPKDPVAHAFVLTVKAHLKANTTRDFAHKLGYRKLDEERKVARWVSGENAPNFQAAFRLLEASGWLKPAGLEAYGHAVQLATTEEAEAALRRAETGEPRPNEKAGRRRG